MDKTTDRPSWQRPADGLSETSLRALIAGEVPALRIADFASARECSAFSAAIREMSSRAQEAVTTRMSLIGVNFSNYGGTDKQGYFDQVEGSYAAVAEIAGKAGFDPLTRMTEMLKAIWPGEVGVASEPGFGRFFAGGIKTRSSSGHLHYDFAPHTAKGFAIAEIVDQLGWNLYLDMPRGTGQTVTYRRQVPREGGAKGGGVARSLNMDRAFVEGAESFSFHPRVGEVAIINTRYPHDIIVENVAPNEVRVQTSAFIGCLPDDRLIMWS